MIDSEHLCQHPISAIDRPGETEYHAPWQRVAERLRQVVLGPLVDQDTLVLDGVDSWARTEPKEADGVSRRFQKWQALSGASIPRVSRSLTGCRNPGSGARATTALLVWSRMGWRNWLFQDRKFAGVPL